MIDPDGGPSEIQGALQFARQRRGDQRHLAQLRCVRAFHRLFGAEPDLRFGAGHQTRRRRGREHDTRRHLHDRVTQIGRRETFRAFGLRHFQIDFIARRDRRLRLFRLDRDRRRELQRFATCERADRGFRGRQHFALPRFDLPQFRRQRLTRALRRVHQERHRVFICRDTPTGAYFWVPPKFLTVEPVTTLRVMARVGRNAPHRQRLTHKFHSGNHICRLRVHPIVRTNGQNDIART